MEGSVPVDGDRETVESRDGTRIGFRRVGLGPVPVVIVHGALNSGEQWVPVASELADACTCYVMVRWGRGLSDDRSDYSLEREVEDVEAVLQAAGSDVSVPTLLLTGSETEDHPSFATRELAEMWPEARVAVLDGQGHAGNLAAPALVAQEIGEFIKTH